MLYDAYRTVLHRCSYILGCFCWSKFNLRFLDCFRFSSKILIRGVTVGSPGIYQAFFLAVSLALIPHQGGPKILISSSPVIGCPCLDPYEESSTKRATAVDHLGLCFNGHQWETKSYITKVIQGRPKILE